MTNINNNNNENNTTGSDVDNLIRQREFGDRFRVAREAAGMSTAEVADELRLAEDIIKSLENSQLDSLPAPTFTQGYIRSYAKILKLPVDDILKAYDRLIPDKDAPLTVSTALAAQKDSSDFAVKLITFGLLIVAIVLFVFWFQQTDFDFINGENDQSHVTEIEVEQEQAEVIEISDEPELEDIQQIPDSAFEPAVEEDTSLEILYENEAAEDEIIKSEAVPSVPVVEESSPEQDQDSKTNTVKDEQTDLETTPDNTEQVQKPVKKNVLITEPIIGSDVLVMATASESWAEVEDANGARLFFDLMIKDKEYKMQGQAPFKLFLGNAPSVTIGVNNRLLNFSDYIRRNNIAHIQISEGGSISPISRRIMLPAMSNDETSNQNPEARETANNLEPALEDE